VAYSPQPCQASAHNCNPFPDAFVFWYWRNYATENLYEGYYNDNYWKRLDGLESATSLHKHFFDHIASSRHIDEEEWKEWLVAKMSGRLNNYGFFEAINYTPDADATRPPSFYSNGKATDIKLRLQVDYLLDCLLLRKSNNVQSYS
jgi:hypothetical protein